MSTDDTNDAQTPQNAESETTPANEPAAQSPTQPLPAQPNSPAANPYGTAATEVNQAPNATQPAAMPQADTAAPVPTQMADGAASENAYPTPAAPVDAAAPSAQPEAAASNSQNFATEQLPPQPTAAAPASAQVASPYTSVPTAPAGYSFARTAQPNGYDTGYAAPAGANAGSDETAYIPRPTASPEQASSFYATDAFAVGSEATSKPTRTAKRRSPGWVGVIAASVLTALVVSAGTVGVLRSVDDSSTTATATYAPKTVATGSTTKTVSSTGSAPDWEAVTNAVANSVVSITVATSSGTAVGSGVIYDSSGHIVTNNHVVSGASEIQVTLADGRIYSAQLTGTDVATDLAVISLDNPPSDLTVAQFGDSDSVVTGQNVMAIGNPLGLSSTVTTGIVSAVDRPVVTTQEEEEELDDSSSDLQRGLGSLLRPNTTTSTSQTYTNAIQIDAAINPGNSGGPLFDETGKVIGITSSIAQVSESSGSVGIGFAIPGNLVVKVADQLISSGKATHAYLGVSISDGSATDGGSTRAGAAVSSVEADSPAGKAGVKEGDVITAINGKATTQAASLIGFVRQYSAGDTVTLTLVRDGEEMEVQATLAERSDSTES